MIETKMVTKEVQVQLLFMAQLIYITTNLAKCHSIVYIYLVQES